MRGTYLYAIVAGEPHLVLGDIGLPDGSTEVGTVVSGGLTAVVSPYDGPDISLISRAEVLQSLVIHEQVIEGIAMEHPTLPVKFGTILASQDEVLGVLSAFARRLHAALDDVGRSVEVDLSATWDLPATFAEISREPEIGDLVSQARNSSGDEAVAARIQAGQLTQQRLERRRDEYRRRIVGELVSFTVDAQPNPLPSDEVVFNVAFLVDRGQLEEFDAAVERLGAEFENKLHFRYVGPLAPYSFGIVQLTRPDPEEVESARRVLELDKQVTEKELRDHYRRLSAQYHPDRNQGDPGASNRFTEIASAHAYLEAYVRGQRDDNGTSHDGETYDLGAAPAVLLLQIKRADVDPGAQVEAGYESGPIAF